jgi:hypothetical protein
MLNDHQALYCLTPLFDAQLLLAACTAASGFRLPTVRGCFPDPPLHPEPESPIIPHWWRIFRSTRVFEVIAPALTQRRTGASRWEFKESVLSPRACLALRIVERFSSPACLPLPLVKPTKWGAKAPKLKRGCRAVEADRNRYDCTQDWQRSRANFAQGSRPHTPSFVEAWMISA